MELERVCRHQGLGPSAQPRSAMFGRFGRALLPRMSPFPKFSLFAGRLILIGRRQTSRPERSATAHDCSRAAQRRPATCFSSCVEQAAFIFQAALLWVAGHVSIEVLAPQQVIVSGMANRESAMVDRQRDAVQRAVVRFGSVSATVPVRGSADRSPRSCRPVRTTPSTRLASGKYALHS